MDSSRGSQRSSRANCGWGEFARLQKRGSKESTECKVTIPLLASGREPSPSVPADATLSGTLVLTGGPNFLQLEGGTNFGDVIVGGSHIMPPAEEPSVRWSGPTPACALPSPWRWECDRRSAAWWFRNTESGLLRRDLPTRREYACTFRRKGKLGLGIEMARDSTTIVSRIVPESQADVRSAQCPVE